MVRLPIYSLCFFVFCSKTVTSQSQKTTKNTQMVQKYPNGTVLFNDNIYCHIRIINRFVISDKSRVEIHEIPEIATKLG